MKKIAQITASLLLGLACGIASAHGDKPESKKAVQTEWGIAGERGKATRDIAVSMNDRMRFVPDKIEVREGETIRFVLKNDGVMLHEFVLGTKKQLDEHAAMMQKFPNMEHNEAYMAHVEPGKTGEVIWTFNRPGEFDFACLIAGHYQAGMKGKIKVSAAR